MSLTKKLKKYCKPESFFLTAATLSFTLLGFKVTQSYPSNCPIQDKSYSYFISKIYTGNGEIPFGFKYNPAIVLSYVGGLVSAHIHDLTIDDKLCEQNE